MKYLMVILALMVVGCTKGSSPICEVTKIIAAPIADEIAVQLDCKDVAAINATITDQLVKLKVCESTAQSVIGDIICPKLIDGLLGGVLKTIPATWQCTGGTFKDTAKTKLLEVCRKAI